MRPCHFQVDLDPEQIEAMRAPSIGLATSYNSRATEKTRLTELVVRKIINLTQPANATQIISVLAELGAPLQEAIPRSSP
jgi:hypothetical protein